jgi:hypothetical protein
MLGSMGADWAETGQTRRFSRYRNLVLLSIGLGLLGVLAGITRSPGRAVHNYRSGPVTTGSRTRTSFPVDLGQLFTFGGIVLENSAGSPAVLEAIRLEPPLNSGMEIVDVKVAGGERRVGYVGTDSQFPPPLLAPHLRPFLGAEVPPLRTGEGRNGVEVVFGLRVQTPGEFGFRKVLVDYRVGKRRHTVRLEDGFMACAPHSAYPGGCDHEKYFRRSS